MKSVREIADFCADEDIKFVKLTFCDAVGQQKNVSIPAGELERAFEYGIAFDASAIRGFENETHSDLFLSPEPDTLTILPWRPEKQRVARILCSVRRPDGSIHECDTRSLLKKAVREAENAGLYLSVGAENKFTVYGTDSRLFPADNAAYLDLEPEDGCCDIRRQVCLMLESMGIPVNRSNHGLAAGQNSLSFGGMSVLRAADTMMTTLTAIKVIAAENELYAETGHITYDINVSGDSGSFIRSTAGRLTELKRFFVPGGGAWKDITRMDSSSIKVTAIGANPFIALMLIIYAGLGNDVGSIYNRLPKPIADLYS